MNALLANHVKTKTQQTTKKEGKMRKGDIDPNQIMKIISSQNLPTKC